MFTHDRMAGASRRRGDQRADRVLTGDQCVPGWPRWLLIVAMVALSHAAQAHGIVGHRVYPAKVAFDDPPVNDPWMLPAVSSRKHPGEGVDDTDNRIGVSFTRL